MKQPPKIKIVLKWAVVAIVASMAVSCVWNILA